MEPFWEDFSEFLRSQENRVMQPFIRGQRAKISQFSTQSQLEVRLQFAGAKIREFDFVCFGLDAQGTLSDDRFMVFFNQRNAPDDAIELAELTSKTAIFALDLDKIPAQIARLAFTASIDGNGAMRDLEASFLNLGENNSTALQYQFSGADFKDEGALMVAEIYRKDGEWRFWAVGQGFVGNLAALLTHFGGEEIEENAAPSPIPTATPAPIPPAPTSAPRAPVSAVVTPATIVATRGNALQKVIDDAPSGATIQLPRGEYQGPIVISRPMTIEAPGAVVWAQIGPVVTIESAGVVLRDFEIEVTAPDANLPDGDVALLARVVPQLHRVGVRGRVVGLGENSDDWNLPPGLDLGEFAPRALNSFQFDLKVPVACELKATVAGVELQPSRVEAGQSSVSLTIRDVLPDTFLAGKIELRSGEIVRSIALSGRSASATMAPVQAKNLSF